MTIKPPKTIYTITYAKSGNFSHGGTWEHPYGVYIAHDREVAERRLAYLTADDWYRKFEPVISEYTLKENED